MRPVRVCCILALVTALAAPGCADKEKTSRDGTPESRPPVTAEAEVKPVPPPAPPAAVPPPMPPTPAASAPERPASPAEQTKETLEPKPPQTAVLAPPKPVLPKPAAPAKEASASGKTQASEAAAPPPPAAKATATKTPGPAIAVVGDSLAVGVGMTMEQRLKPQEGLGCLALGKVSTGLISKRLLDWEKRLSELVATQKPAVVVVVMGGNDANNGIGGKMAGSPEWGAAYRQKVDHFVRIATGAGVKVIWVGLPAMRDPAYAARVRAVNAAAKEACGTISGCTYMEAGDTFVDASGNYVQAKDIGGKQVTLRGKDGVHMTMTGYDLLCRQVLDRLGRNGDLPAPK
jgi:uncharacterized protein